MDMAIYSLAQKQAFGLESVIDLKINSLKVSSRKTYGACWNLFARWLDQNNFTVETLSQLHAAEYISQLAKTPGRQYRDRPQHQTVSRATVRQHANILTSFFAYFVSYGVIKNNPFSAINSQFRGVKTGSRQKTEMIPFEYAKKLLELPSEYTLDGIRDRSLIALLLGCGLRCSELLNLLICDVKLTANNQPYIFLRDTKSGESPDMPLADWVWNIVKINLDKRRKMCESENEPLHVQYYVDGTPERKLIPDRTMRTWAKNWFKKCGLPATLTVHSFRATAITKLLSDQIPVLDVKDFARHSSIQTTLRYDKRTVLTDKNPSKTIKY